jgi:hypothetical protein
MSDSSPAPADTEAALRAELRGLMQFVHLAPVGLVQARMDGHIALMNPMATQLLAPLNLFDGEGELNLFDILDKASPDLRTLVQTFKRTTGVSCNSYRILMPEIQSNSPAALDAPIALGITALMLPGTLDCLMVVLTDESAHIKLQRIKASWAPS